MSRYKIISIAIISIALSFICLLNAQDLKWELTWQERNDIWQYLASNNKMILDEAAKNFPINTYNILPDYYEIQAGDSLYLFLSHSDFMSGYNYDKARLIKPGSLIKIIWKSQWEKSSLRFYYVKSEDLGVGYIPEPMIARQMQKSANFESAKYAKFIRNKSGDEYALISKKINIDEDIIDSVIIEARINGWNIMYDYSNPTFTERSENNPKKASTQKTRQQEWESTFEEATLRADLFMRLQMGSYYQLPEETMLMPVLHPDDPLEALKYSIQAPAGIKVKILDVRSYDTGLPWEYGDPGTPWYYVKVYEGPRDGWKNIADQTLNPDRVDSLLSTYDGIKAWINSVNLMDDPIEKLQ